jgi:hypothetical protein
MSKSTLEARAKAIELARQINGPFAPLKSVLRTAADIEAYLLTGETGEQ